MTAFWWFVREWKAGEISVLAIALILSVTMVTGSFSESLMSAMVSVGGSAVDSKRDEK